MYKEVQASLEEAGRDDSVVCAVLAGAGDYYSSGNDLSNFTQIPPEGPQKLAAEGKEILRCVIDPCACIILYVVHAVKALDWQPKGVRLMPHQQPLENIPSQLRVFSVNWKLGLGWEWTRPLAACATKIQVGLGVPTP